VYGKPDIPGPADYETDHRKPVKQQLHNPFGSGDKQSIYKLDVMNNPG
jgi:hypothetical protein